MKFTPFLAAAILAFTTPISAMPRGTKTITRRADSSEACSLGFCTLNGGTTGGAGGNTVTVTTVDELEAAASADGAAIIIVDGQLTGNTKIRVAADKTIVGTLGSSLINVGLLVKGVSNVIIRNLKIAKVVADNGDAIGIQDSTNVWVDHCDLSSDMDNGKDFYDGLLDITHASEFVTVSNTFFHDHYKASLVGHSDSNGDEDTGHLKATYVGNYWHNINSRGPSVRFGTGHIVNSYYQSCGGAINTRMGAQVLVESTQFESCGSEVIASSDSDKDGYATVNDVDLGSSKNTAPAGNLSQSDLGYTIDLVGSAKVKAAVYGTAGQTLEF